MITDRIRVRLASGFSGEAHAQATALVQRIPDELDLWNVVTETDRVEAAVLKLAAGDLDELRKVVDLALKDWRDVLVAAGDG